MRVVITAVGRAKPGPIRDLYDHYAARLGWPLALKEVEERRTLPPAALREREGALLLAARPPGAKLIALDASGRQITSEALAELLGNWRDDGTPAVAFAIGGPEGLSAAVLGAADRIVSFGAVTWPHMLVRPLLLEQLYRAQSILSGHPYHRA